MRHRKPSPRKIVRFREELLKWAAVHGRDYPWRRTRDVYRLLVAELMLRRTRSDQVAAVYRRFLGRFPTLQSLASARDREVKHLLYPLGLEHRADQMASFAAEARARYGRGLPSNPDELREIRGVGHYVANAVACFSTGEPVSFIDVNVARVLGRVFGLPNAVDWRYADSRTRRKLIETATRCVPERDPRTYHYALLDFGATVCRPTPACPDCPMHRVRICDYCREGGSSSRWARSSRRRVPAAPP